MRNEQLDCGLSVEQIAASADAAWQAAFKGVFTNFTGPAREITPAFRVAVAAFVGRDDLDGKSVHELARELYMDVCLRQGHAVADFVPEVATPWEATVRQIARLLTADSDEAAELLGEVEEWKEWAAGRLSRLLAAK